MKKEFARFISQILWSIVFVITADIWERKKREVRKFYNSVINKPTKTNK